MIEIETMMGRLSVHVESRGDYQLQPKERLKTCDFLAFEAFLAENTAYRPSGEIMNIAARRSAVNKNEISMYTEYEDAVRCGKAAEEALSLVVKKTLESEGVHVDGDCEVSEHSSLDNKTGTIESPMASINLSTGAGDSTDDFSARVIRLASEHNSQSSKDHQMKGVFSFENSTECVAYISVDDVLVHRQKTVRKNGKECVRSTWIYHTVVHIETVEGIYILEASSQKKAISAAMAYLTKNGFTDRYLIFFMDGEETIKEGINEVFSGWPHTILMDYYHVSERITELFSSAFKPGKIVDDTQEPEYFKNGRVKKQSIKKITRSQYYVRMFMSKIWYGNIDDALEWLEKMKESDELKPSVGLTKIESVITYINNKRDRMTCFAMRRLLGLRNSSNQVEIANNTMVAHRQKRNGLSWSDEGSFACSQNTMIFKNHESEDFFKKGVINFAPRAISKEDEEGEIRWIQNAQDKAIRMETTTEVIRDAA